MFAINTLTRVFKDYDNRDPVIAKMQRLLYDREVINMLKASGITLNPKQFINSKILVDVFTELVSSKCSPQFAIDNFDVVSMKKMAKVRDEEFLRKVLPVVYPRGVYDWEGISDVFGPLFTRKELSESFIRDFIYLIGRDVELEDKILERDLSESTILYLNEYIRSV